VRHAGDGRLRVEFGVGGAEYGVPFLEAYANCTLSSLHYLDNTDTDIAKDLVLDIPSPQDKIYPLVFMVTKFICGGFTIGMGCSHVVCDGYGSIQVFKAIVELAKGRSEPSVIPVWERERLVGSTSTSKQPLPPLLQPKEPVAFSPLVQPKTVIKIYCFRVESEVIKRLKMSLMKEGDSESEPVTTYESLGAYVWRSRARALQLSTNGKTMLNMLVGIRRGMKGYDPLPKGYYGNTTVDGKVVLKVSELNEMPLYEIVKLIKETKKVASTTDYVKKSINTPETENKQGFSMDGSGAVTILTEWKHLGFLDENSIDFGGYESVNFVPAPCSMFASLEGCIFASPSILDDDNPSMKGGVKIFTSLPVAAMPKFKEEIEALRLFN